MNQGEYLKLLERYLLRLPEAERKDILRDQEEMIRDAVASGRSEEDFIKSLGDPRTYASAVIAESRIQAMESSTNLNSAMRNSFPAVLAVMALAPFNLIFVLVPYLILLGFMFSGWMTVIVGAGVSLALLGFFFTEAIFISVEPAVHIASGFTLFGVLSGFLFAGGLMVLITKVFVNLSMRYLKWNLKFVKQI